MKLNILGVVLGLSSSAYIALVSWNIGHIGFTPTYLAFAIAAGLSLFVTALLGIFSGRGTTWRRIALVCVIPFGTIGVLVATPAITMTMLAVDDATDECFRCDESAGENCDGLCLKAYKDIHVALFLLTLIECLAGTLLVSSASYIVCRSSRTQSISISSQETVETFVSTSTV